MIQSDREYILEEEWLMVRHSGEIPEVALHGSLHFLQEDAEGPHLLLTDEEIGYLQQAVLSRYQEMVLRDLDLDNRDLPLFRGVRRACHNWKRFEHFAAHIGKECHAFRNLAARSLLDYMEREVGEVLLGVRKSSVNCSAAALSAFAGALGVMAGELPEGWESVCVPEAEGS